MFGVCAWRSVWRGMLWLFVVMWQHNVWCVCVAFCVERYVVVISGNGAAQCLVCVRGVLWERYAVVICGNGAA